MGEENVEAFVSCDEALGVSRSNQCS